MITLRFGLGISAAGTRGACADGDAVPDGGLLRAETEHQAGAAPGPAARRGCCRAATPTSSCRAATVACSSPTPAAGTS